MRGAFRYAHAAGAAALVVGLALAATQGQPARGQSNWTGSSSADQLLYRLDVLDAEIADIRARLGGVTGQARPQPGSTSAGAWEAEIRALTAAVERLENTQRQLTAELTRRLGDIEFRLNELEGNPAAAAPAPLLPGQGAFAGVDVTPGRTDSPVVSVSEQGDLDRAIDDVNRGRFDQAEDRLRRFLVTYPGSPLVGSAWYWLGESQSVRGLHAEAARSFLSGYQSDRTGQRASHNLYKLGVTLGRLGQVNEACLTLREVRNQFPAAPDDIPAKADAEADSLTCG